MFSKHYLQKDNDPKNCLRQEQTSSAWDVFILVYPSYKNVQERRPCIMENIKYPLSHTLHGINVF